MVLTLIFALDLFQKYTHFMIVNKIYLLCSTN